MKHIPNAPTYRPWLGEETNIALFMLVEEMNRSSFIPLGVNDYLRKMISHWWDNVFPDEPFPVELKPYIEDFDLEEIVQSVKL